MSTTNQTVEYSAAVTGHAVLFAFVVIPLGMFIFPGLLRLPTECYTKNPATQPRVSLIYWLPVFAAIVFPLWSINSGWTFYEPLWRIACPEIGANWWVTMVAISTTVLLVLFIHSVIRNRNAALCGRPTLTFITAHFFAIFVLPLLLVALGSLMLDRLGGVSIFDYPLGSPVLYETMFWVFGHPEVYLLVLPFTGLLFFIRPFTAAAGQYTKSRRMAENFGGSITRVALVSFFVFGHHLFATSLTGASKTFFILASLYIMIPMFDVVRRIFHSRRHFSAVSSFSRSALFFGFTAVSGFFIGGILSLFFLSPHLATAVHGTRWVVGHFHFFFVVFLFSAVAIFVLLFIGTRQIPCMSVFTVLGGFVVAASTAFFVTSIASGLFGGLRRVVAIHGTGGTWIQFTNVVLVAVALLALLTWLRSISGRLYSKLHLID